MFRIGIDLGGTNIVAGLVEQNFRIVDKCSVKTRVPRSVESMAADMAQMAQTLLNRSRRCSASAAVSAGQGRRCCGRSGKRWPGAFIPEIPNEIPGSSWQSLTTTQGSSGQPCWEAGGKKHEKPL